MVAPLYLPALNLAVASLLLCLAALALGRLVYAGCERRRYRLYMTAICVCLLAPLPIILGSRLNIAWHLPIAPQSEVVAPEVFWSENVSPSEAIVSPPVINVAVNTEPQSSQASVDEAQNAVSIQKPIKKQPHPIFTNFRPRIDTVLAWLPPTLLCIWFIGSVAYLLRLLRGWRYLLRLDRSLNELSSHYAEVVEDVQARLGTSIRVKESSRLTAPLTFGLWQPVVVLPTQIDKTLDDEQLQAVLLHECGHVLRHDTLQSLVQALTKIVFWWNPLIRILNRQIRETREVLCDDFARALSAQPRALAEGMLKLAEQTFEPAPCEWCVSILSGFQSLEARMHRLLSETPRAVTPPTLLSNASFALYAMLVVALCVPFDWTKASSVQAQESSTNATTAPSTISTKANIRGVVKDEKGQPLKGVSVWMLISKEGDKVVEQTQTDDQGLYAFESKRQGNISVAATTADTCWAVRHLYGVEPGQRKYGIDLTLTPSQTVRLAIRNEDGAAAEGAEVENFGWRMPNDARVFLLREIAEPSSFGWPIKISGSSITLSKIPRGAEVMAGIVHPQFTMNQLQSSTLNKEPIPIVLKRGNALTIVAKDALTQQPIPSAEVTVIYYDAKDLRNALFRHLKTDAQGQCGLILGNVRALDVRVDSPKRLPIKHQFRHEWGRDPTSETITIEMKRRATVRGRVIDAVTNKPAAGARVGILIDQREYLSNTMTDADGNFELVGVDGPAWVNAMPGAGYEADEQDKVPVELKADEVMQMTTDLMVRKLPPLQGTVMYEGQPIAGALVTVADRNADPVVTDRAGKFAINIDNDGRVFLEAVHLEKQLSGLAPVTREAFQPVVQLKPDHEIRGKVGDWKPDSKNPKEIYIYRSLVDGGSSQVSLLTSSRLNDKGEFIFRGMAQAAEYRIAARPVYFSDTDDKLPWIRLKSPVTVLEPLEHLELLDAQPLPAPLPPSIELQCAAWHNSPALKLADLRGKVVLINFWDLSRDSTVRALPWLNRLHQAWSDKGLVVIGVHNNSQPLEQVIHTADELQLTYPLAVDNADGRTINDLNALIVRQFVLIDHLGRCHETGYSPMQLFQNIQRLLDEAK